MNCCTFGTIRIDILMNAKLENLKNEDELKTDKIIYEIGGSVFNTSELLANYTDNITMYTLNMEGVLNDFIVKELNKKRLDIKLDSNDTNENALSFVFLKNNGEKKMISYDGVRNDSNILRIIQKKIVDDDIFYTSIYEINKENFESVISIYKIMEESNKVGMLDLSPLMDSIKKEHWKRLLSSLTVLCGTKEEMDSLLNKLELKSPDELIKIFEIKYIFEKRGESGAAVYKADNIIEMKLEGNGISNNTTGCGDAFNAGVIIGLIEQKSADEILRRAIQLSEYVAYFDSNILCENLKKFKNKWRKENG